MARASTPTLLSLDRWAKHLAVSPVHFNGAAGADVWLDQGSCDDIWPQYAWQVATNIVSREEVAMAIATAERDIAQVLGYWPAPKWFVDERHTFPHTTRGVKTIEALWGKIIAPGRRAVSEIDLAAAVVRSDPDGDGWAELATVTVATDVTEKREVKLYTAGMGGLPEWEIRPLRNVVISGGVATITLDSWLLLDPDLWEVAPSTNGFAAIDIADSSKFVATVDVYREYNDTSQAGSRFYSGSALGYSYWPCACGGAGCGVCGVTTQEGCFSVINSRMSAVRPFPATYNGSAWTAAPFTACVAPAEVSLSYYAGEVDSRYRASQSLDPLGDYLAEAIVWLSVARLPQGVCGCDRIKWRIDELQRDLSRFRDTQGSAIYTRFKEQEIFSNPFGTRSGEVKAWERVSALVNDQVWSAGLL